MFPLEAFHIWQQGLKTSYSSSQWAQQGYHQHFHMPVCCKEILPVYCILMPRGKAVIKKQRILIHDCWMSWSDLKNSRLFFDWKCKNEILTAMYALIELICENSFFKSGNTFSFQASVMSRSYTSVFILSKVTKDSITYSSELAIAFLCA